MKKSVKNGLLSILSTLSIFAFTTGLVISSDAIKKVYAAEATTWETGTFEMTDGVSLKLSEKSGLRYIAKMDSTVYEFLMDNESAEMGFIIAPEQLMEEANGDYINMSKKVGGAIDKEKIYQSGDYYLVNGCLTNINYANFEYDFAAVAYIKYDDAIRYTEYNDLARNNLYDTVNMAALNGYAEEVFALETYTGTDDPNDDSTGWYGSETFPIVIENSAEYNALVDIVNGTDEMTAIDLSTYTAVIKNDAVATKSFSNTENKPSILSWGLYEINKLIAALPDSLTMPEGIGFIERIKEAEEKYAALSDSDKASVENYAKVESLLTLIEGYDRVYKNDADDGTVIASYVPNYTSTVGGSATTREDALYGNVLKVTSDAYGKAALSWSNFPSVEKYEKIYFYVRILGVSCDIYLSNGITNDGWGTNWKNTWSTSGYWCNADTFRLVEIDVSNDLFIENGEFALGFRTTETGISFEISDIYGVLRGDVQTGMSFGTIADSGTTNEYGTVYNFTQGWSSEKDLGAFNVGALSGCLAEGHDSLRFYIYNPNASDVTLYFTENETWTRMDGPALTAGAWTEVVITPEIIASNDTYLTYVSVESGAGTSGWQISPIYSFNSNSDYTDYEDVKEVIALIDAIPENMTLADEATVETARTAYDKLTSSQKASVTNVAKLTTAEAYIEDVTAANEVVALIDSINARDVDETLVNEARTAYDALTATQQGYVTNIATLEAYEAEIKAANDLVAAAADVQSKIAALPDSVVMPDHFVFVPRIEAAKDAYNALSVEGKGMVSNYAKLSALLQMIDGYTTVHRQSVDSVDVIPNYHTASGNTSETGGTASTDYDSYYGNYLKVTSASDGTAAIQYKNFPDISEYTTLYFVVRVTGASCDIYLSDGITNDGWGDNWHNTFYDDGYWVNDGYWINKAVSTTTGVFSSNWALGFKTNVRGITFEITDIVGYKLDLGTQTGMSFGNITDSGTTNAYGTVYNFTQGWSSEKDLGAFNVGALSGCLAEGHDSLRFYIYNPNESDVTLYFTENETWKQMGNTTLTAGAWTEAVITSEIVASNDTYLTYVNVDSGAGTAGWQISPMYSFSSIEEGQDDISKLQLRIDALDTETPNEYQVGLAREAYEALAESEKALIDITNLIACETELYGNVDNAPFIVDGVTDYKIYIDQTDSSLKSAIKVAATFMNEQLQAATGVEPLSIVTDKPTTITKYRYAIVFGYEDLYAELGLTIPDASEIGDTGYAIVKTGRTVFIIAYGADGYRMGMLAFLREVIGYDMISEDCIVYSLDGDTLPELNLVEKPSFDYRQQQTYLTADEIYGMGLHAHTDIWIPSSEGWDMHNTLHYIPQETYGTVHSSWYYTAADNDGTERPQICPTAGGSSTEFNAMVEAIVSNMMTQINAYPTIENISFSIMDSAGGDKCTCAGCKLYDTVYGTSGYSAAWIDLMNAINEGIQAQIGDRELKIAFLAYRDTEAAPANDDNTLMKRYEIKDGTSTATDEYLQCDENVIVWLAPINGKYAENLNHADNAETLSNIKKWRALSDNVYLWMYGTNFKYYMYPYNTWQASAENYKILADLGVKAAWSQSNETEATAFSDLKSYIDSKFMFNVNAEYETVLDAYFTNYYGAAATSMRSMFDTIVEKCNTIESENDGLGRGIYDEYEYESGWLWKTTNTYWSEDELNALLALCNEAYAAIEADTTLTDEQKTAFKNRITKESLFPRYVLCTVYEDTSLRAAFKADCEALGVTKYRESDGELSDLYSDWGV